MWIDAKPKGGIQILTAFAFNVEGQPVNSPTIVVLEPDPCKNVVSDGQSYQVTLDFQLEHLGVGRNVTITFKISDVNGSLSPIWSP